MMKVLFETEFHGYNYAVVEMNGKLYWCKVYKRELTGQDVDDYQIMVRLI